MSPSLNLKDYMADTKVNLHNEIKSGVPRKDWVYVEIPEEGMLGSFDLSRKTPLFMINHYQFTAGKHLVPPEIASTLIDRVAVWKAQQLKLVRPDIDAKALQQLAGNASVGSGTIGDASAL